MGTSVSIMLKVYGHYISQPARSVLWLLKIHSVRFEFIKTDPIRGDTQKSDFAAKFPLQRIPAIQDDDITITNATNGSTTTTTTPLTLAESSAIMIYLCEK